MNINLTADSLMVLDSAPVNEITFNPIKTIINTPKPSKPTPIVKYRLKSFTIKQKLDVLKHFEKGVRGKGLDAISKKFNVSVGSLRKWVSKKEELLKAVKDPNIQIRKARRLTGGGQKAQYPEMEIKLVAWINDSFSEGLYLSDRKIQLTAMQFFQEIYPNYAELPFKASKGWLYKFKTRNKSVAKVQIKRRKDHPETS